MAPKPLVNYGQPVDVTAELYTDNQSFRHVTRPVEQRLGDRGLQLQQRQAYL